MIEEKDVVHLARLCLEAKAQDVQLFVRRLSRKYRESLPNFASELVGLLQQMPTRSTPLRQATVEAVPVDQDSRLDLVRIEELPALEVDPIWSSSVHSSLQRIINDRRHSEELLKAGLDPIRSAMFVGPPGVGKTLAARWLANQLGWPLLTLDLSAVMSSYLGRTGTNLRYVLDYAKGLQCILLLDEFDAIAKKRDDNAEIGELKRLVTVLLQEIDAWPGNGILLAATNHAALLDPAIWRRFEYVIEFPMPAPDLVMRAIRGVMGGTKPEVEPWISVLAAFLAGKSYSDISRAIITLRREAVLEKVPVEEILARRIPEWVGLSSHKERISLAHTMAGSTSLSHREIQRLTGVSRDTLRKKLNTVTRKGRSHGRVD